MRAKVNKEICIGCGLCVSLAPEDFAMDSDGKAQPKNEAVKDETAARQAVSDCPVTAIRLEEEPA